MHRMSTDEFREIVADVRARWPRMPFCETVAADWWAYLNRYTASEVRAALRHHFATSRFHPKIVEIEDAIRKENAAVVEPPKAASVMRGDEFGMREFVARDPGGFLSWATSTARRQGGE